jgi:hypothetical protein
MLCQGFNVPPSVCEIGGGEGVRFEDYAADEVDCGEARRGEQQLDVVEREVPLTQGRKLWMCSERLKWWCFPKLFFIIIIIIDFYVLLCFG